MKPEQVLRRQKQQAIVYAEQDKLRAIDEESTETPKGSEELTLGQRFEKMYRALFDMLDDVAYQQPRETHGYTPIVPIPYEYEGELVPLHLQFEITDDMYGSGKNIKSQWFTYDFNDGLPRLYEEINEKQVEEAERRATSPYPGRVKREFDNFEWSVVQYTDAVSKLTLEELLERHFTKEFVEQHRTQLVA